jgi:hypothetical protein
VEGRPEHRVAGDRAAARQNEHDSRHARKRSEHLSLSSVNGLLRKIGSLLVSRLVAVNPDVTGIPFGLPREYHAAVREDGRENWLTGTLLVFGMMAAFAAPSVSHSGSAIKPIRISSVPVSPSVVATAATREGHLVLLVLWRGSPLWHSAGLRSSQGGGDERGRITQTLQYGDRRVALSFDSAARTAIIQGKSATLPRGTNVLLVDDVDTPSGGGLTKALSIDAADVDLHPRLGLAAWVPLLRRSREVVEFLQCGAVPVDTRSVEPCQYLKKR